MVTAAQKPRWRTLGFTLLSWFDSSTLQYADTQPRKRLDWLRTLPYLAMHVACVGVIWVGWSPTAVAVGVLLFAVRMLAITGFYHRYFSHRSFKTSRLLQFLFALVGASAAQRGPIWWAAHHRHHHAVAERADDPHSPAQHGFWWSHTGWFLSPANFPIREERVRDWLKFPELRFLDRFDSLVPIAAASLMFGAGAMLAEHEPQLGTSGAQMLVWFFISTVVLYHSTFSINSLAHRWGRRRYPTADESRNNFWLALLTFGEGWHNNHHHYPVAARQGFYWWEIDVTYYFLRLLAALGLIWDLRTVPRARREARECRVAPTPTEAA